MTDPSPGFLLALAVALAVVFLAGMALGTGLSARRRAGRPVEAVDDLLPPAPPPDRSPAPTATLRNEDLFERHPTPMWIYDLGTLAFLAVNDAAVHRYGWSEAEFLRMTIADIRPPEDVSRLNRHRTPESRRGYGDAGTWRHLTKSGEVIHMHITLNRVRHQGQEVHLVMAREVTQDVEARRALQALTDSLEQRVAERTEALAAANAELDAFARTAAHDLRNPLHGILGLAHLARTGRRDEPGGLDTGEALARIEDSARTMLSLVDSLLRMSRVAHKPLSVEDVDLGALARRAVDELRSAEPGRHVDFVVDGDLALRGDAGLLGSLVANLLSNAWKYTRTVPGARIELGRERGPDGATVYLVRDNGVGFPMDQAGRLFKPFQRLHTDHQFEGHGVGLVTCQRIVHRHGGRIWATSEPGVGTVVRFTLPGAPAQAEGAEAA